MLQAMFITNQNNLEALLPACYFQDGGNILIMSHSINITLYVHEKNCTVDSYSFNYSL